MTILNQKTIPIQKVRARSNPADPCPNSKLYNIIYIFSEKIEEEYPELPKANSIVALPADALKEAGSGMSNSSLSHMQQWLADMKKQGEDQLKGLGSILTLLDHYESHIAYIGLYIAYM